MVLLNPDPTQGVHCGNLPEPPRRVGGINSDEQEIAIVPDGQHAGVMRFLPCRWSIVLGPAGVALGPFRRCLVLQPIRSHHCQTIEGVTHRLADHFDPVERPHGSEDMRRIGPLPLLAPVQQGVKQQLLSLTIVQPGAKLAEDRGVEAGIGQFGVEDVFLVDPAPECIRRAAVGEFFGKLENRYEG